MANAIYPLFKAGILQGTWNLSSANIKVALVDTGVYTYSAAHDFLADVASTVALSGNLASKTFTSGVFDSADPTFTAASGSVSEALILYVDTGSGATSALIAYYDTGVTNLPVTPNGGDIGVTVNASGWLAL